MVGWDSRNESKRSGTMQANYSIFSKNRKINNAKPCASPVFHLPPAIHDGGLLPDFPFVFNVL
jgi:hypothetical protein